MLLRSGMAAIGQRRAPYAMPTEWPPCLLDASRHAMPMPSVLRSGRVRRIHCRSCRAHGRPMTSHATAPLRPPALHLPLLPSRNFPRWSECCTASTGVCGTPCGSCWFAMLHLHVNRSGMKTTSPRNRPVAMYRRVAILHSASTLRAIDQRACPSYMSLQSSRQLPPPELCANAQCVAASCTHLPLRAL